MLVQIAQHLFRRPGLSKIGSGIGTIHLPHQGQGDDDVARSANQIDEVVRDIDDTIAQTVQVSSGPVFLPDSLSLYLYFYVK